MSGRSGRATDRAFLSRSLAVVAYAIAMGYLEAAVVVYLRRSLNVEAADLFPVQQADATGGFAAIEFGRELATLVMLATVGWLAGRRPLERLAWVAVAFGVWDVTYYAWLFVFSGWPPSPETWDILFLVPTIWTGPVWAPCTVSGALVGFGLAGARASSLGWRLRVTPAEAAAAIAGGFLVVLSFTIDAPRILAGGLPDSYPWPIFAAGMGLAIVAAAAVLIRARPADEQPMEAARGAH